MELGENERMVTRRIYTGYKNGHGSRCVYRHINRFSEMCQMICYFSDKSKVLVVKERSKVG